MEKYHNNKTPRDEEYVKAYLKYHSQLKAAEECGVGRETIARAVRRANIPLLGQKMSGNHGGGTPEKITDEQLLECVKTMTRKEIADKYGVHITRIDKRMQRLNVHAVKAKPIQKPRAPRAKRKKKYSTEWKWTLDKAAMVERTQDGRFELVEFQSHGRMRLRCKECGTINERAMSTVRQKRVVCEECERRKAEIQSLHEARAGLLNVLRAVAEKSKPKVCIGCGKTFYSEISDKKYCSRSCRNKSNGGYRSRARRYGVRYESGITLIKVFKRDKGICQICGKPVNWDDHSWGESFGATYPTIDHITAFANGGPHTWDNVQLAHAICNSYKRDQ